MKDYYGITDEEYEEVIKLVIKDGLQCGKCPWSASMIVQEGAARALRLHGIYEEETMEQTIARHREKEERDK